MSKIHSYIDQQTKARYRLKKYITLLVFLAVLLLVNSNHTGLVENRLKAGLSTAFTEVRAWVSYPVRLYESAAFVDEDLFTDYSGVFPDLNDLARQEMIWLIHMWGIWGAGLGLCLPLISYLMFQIVKRIWDRTRKYPPLDSQDVSTYLDIQKQIRRAFWRANNHNFEKAIFLVALMGVLFFSVQLLFQPFVIISHNLLISALVSYLIYASAVYFFYLFLQRFGYLRVVRIVDREMDLRESLVTALDKGRDYRSSSLYLYLLDETRKKVEKEKVLGLFPFKFPRFDRRNVGVTTSFLAVMIFCVSLSLPAVAFVYGNLRREVLALGQEDEYVEQIILEESDQIRLLGEDMEEKESVELELLAMELSGLSDKLDEIAQGGMDVPDAERPDLTFAQDEAEQLELADDEGNNDKDDGKPKPKVFHEEDEIVINQARNVFINAQIDTLIKDLIRYNLKNNARTLDITPPNLPTNEIFVPKTPTSSDQASKGSDSQPKDAEVRSVQENVPDTMGRDINKLQKLVLRMQELLEKLNRRFMSPPRQVAQKNDNDKHKSDEENDKSISPGLSQQNQESLSDISPAPSPPPEITPLSANQQEYDRDTADDQDQDSQISPPEADPAKQSKDDASNDSQRKSLEAEEEEKERWEIIHPHDIEFFEEELTEITEDMGYWEFGWEEEDSVFGHIPFRRRMRLNSRLLEKLKGKLVTITVPENISGLPPNATKPVVRIDSPDEIQSQIGQAKDKSVVNPVNIKAASTDLRLVANDLKSLNSRINEFVEGRRGLSGHQTGFNGKDPIVSRTDNVDWAKDIRESSDPGTPDSRSENNYRPRPGRQRPNLGQRPDMTRLGNLDSAMMQDSLQRGVMQYYRSGANPESALRQMSLARNRVTKNSGVREIIDGLENLRSDVQNMAEPTPSEQSLDNIPSTPSGNSVNQVAGLSERTQRQRNSENIRNFPTEPVGQERDYQLPAGNTPDDRVYPARDDRQQLQQEKQQLRSQATPQGLQNMGRDLGWLSDRMRNQALGKSTPTDTTSAAMFQDPAYASMGRDFDRISEQMRSAQDPTRLQNLSAELYRLVNRYRGMSNLQADSTPNGGDPNQRTDGDAFDSRSKVQPGQNPPDVAAGRSPRFSIPQNAGSGSKHDAGNNVAVSDSGRERRLSRDRALRLNQELSSSGSQIRDISQQMQNERDPQEMDRLKGQLLDRVDRYRRDFLRNPDLHLASPQMLARFDGELGDLSSSMRQDTTTQNQRDLAKRMDRVARDASGSIRQEGGEPQDQAANRQLAYLGNQAQNMNQLIQNERNPQNLKRLQGEFLDRVNQFRRQASMLSPSALSGNDPQMLAQLDRDLGNMAGRMRQEPISGNRQDIARRMTGRIRDAFAPISQDGKLFRDRNMGDSRQLASAQRQTNDTGARTHSEQNPQNLDNFQNDQFDREQESTQQVMNPPHPSYSAVGDNTRLMAHLNRDLGELPHPIPRELDQVDQRNLLNLESPPIEKPASQISQSGRLQGQLPRDMGQNQQSGFLGKDIMELTRQIQTETSPENLEKLQNDLVERMRDFREQVQSVSNPASPSMTGRSSDGNRDGQEVNQLKNRRDGRQNRESKINPSSQLTFRTEDSSNLQTEEKSQNTSNAQNRQQAFLGTQTPDSQFSQQQRREDIKGLRDEILNLSRQFQDQGSGPDPDRQSTPQAGKDTDLIGRSRRLNERLRRERNIDQARMLTERLASAVRDIGLSDRDTGHSDRQSKRISDRLGNEQDPARLKNLKDSPADNLSQLREERQANGLDRHLERLSQELRRQSEPDRIRDLNDEVSRLIGQLERRDRDRMAQDDQNNHDLQLRDDSLEQMSRLSDRLGNEQDPAMLKNLKDSLADNLSQLRDERQSTGQERAGMDRRLEGISQELRRQSDPDRIRDLNNEVSRLLGQLKRRDRDRMAHDDQNNHNLQLRDDSYDQMLRLSDRLGHEQDPARFKNLKDRLADNLMQYRSSGQDRFDENPSQLQQKQAANLEDPQARKDDRTSSTTRSTMDSLTDKTDPLQMRNDRDPKQMRDLQREIVRLTDRLLQRAAQHSPAPDGLDGPLDALNNRMQEMAGKLSADQPLAQMQDTVKQLSVLSQEMKMSLPESSGKEPATTPQDRPQELRELVMAIDELTGRMQKAKETDAVMENIRQLAKLTRQMKDMNKMRSSRQEHSSHRQSDDRGNLFDPSRSVQWFKQQKQNKTIESDQGQLVKLNKQMVDSTKKVLLGNTPASIEDKLLSEQEKEIAGQFLQLSQKLKKVDDSAELVEVSKRMNRLANRLLAQGENRTSLSRNRRSQFNKNRPLAQAGSLALDKKTAAIAYREDSKVNDIGSSGNEKKAALAISKIEDMIEKLKAYNSSERSEWKNSNDAPKGGSSTGSGISQQPLPLANRFIAEKVAKETSRVPDTGPIRNSLTMEHNLHRSDVFERVIRRLEEHKKTIGQSGGRGSVKSVSLKDYSEISRSSSRQPSGLENIRYVDGGDVKVPHRYKSEDKPERGKTVSYMDNEQLFLTSRLKGEDKHLLDKIPEREIRTKKSKTARLPTSQVASESVIENIIPPKYQSIFKRLFSPVGGGASPEE